MRLTLKTDYALRSLIYLGRKQGLASIGEVAGFYRISENHLVKVVHELGRRGFVETLRGKGGGIRLARPASEIRIGEVVRAMEDDLALAACFAPQEPDKMCRLTDACGLQGLLHRALKAFMAELDAKTLAELLAPFPKGGAEILLPPEPPQTIR